MRLVHAIIHVSDMKRSVTFYRDALGLKPRFESAYWTEFSAGEASIALHLSPLPGVPASDEAKTAGRCHPGLSVINLDEFHARMVSLGVPCLQPPQQQFGTRLAEYQDPDGLAISVSEEKGSAGA